MSKTIEEQVEEYVEKYYDKNEVSGLSGKFFNYKHLVDDIRDNFLPKALQERDRIAREQAIKECEGCVPEEKTKKDLDYLDGTGYKNEGHNTCREQTLPAISKLRV